LWLDQPAITASTGAGAPQCIDGRSSLDSSAILGVRAAKEVREMAREIMDGESE
jgi:hypothetical protein